MTSFMNFPRLDTTEILMRSNQAASHKNIHVVSVATVKLINSHYTCHFYAIKPFDCVEIRK